MRKPIINVADVSLDPTPAAFAPVGSAAERFEARTGVIGAHIGARNLGYNITAVPPSKRAWPFHSHPVKEEMFFVLQGNGEVRIGEARYPIRTGDIIACLAATKQRTRSSIPAQENCAISQSALSIRSRWRSIRILASLP